MGKVKNPRRVADNEAMAVSRMLRTSPQKLNLVAAMITGRKRGEPAEAIRRSHWVVGAVLAALVVGLWLNVVPVPGLERDPFVALTDDVAAQHVLPEVGEPSRIVAVDHHLAETADHTRSPSDSGARPNTKNASR